VGGDKIGARCIFPFTINTGRVYNGCIVDEHDPEARLWCSVKTDAYGNHISGQGEWGYCDSACRTHQDGPSNPDVLYADVSASAQTQGYTGSYAKTGDLHKGFPIYKGPDNKLLYVNDDSNWCFGSKIEVNTCDLQSSSTSSQFVQAICPADVETWYFFNPDLEQWQPGVFTISVTRIDGKC